MEKKSVSDIVFSNIEEKIISGEWAPGTKITSEPQLARELNVSRMSVREAIEKLATLNILTKKQGEGTFVNELKPAVYLNSLIPMMILENDDYLDILEFRLIVEVESARLCAEKITSEDLVELKKYYNNMIEFSGDSLKFAEADMNFHMKIAEGTGNSLIIKINSILKSLLSYHQRELYKDLGPSGGIAEHKRILEAIENKDSELSAIFMKRHIMRTINEIKNVSE